jgi:small subunit ribosomal protein S11
MKINKKINTYNFGYIKIKPTSNNIFITLTDNLGNVLLSKHAGLLDFKGSKKKTPFVASQVIRNLIEEIKNTHINIKLYILQVHGYIRNSSINSIIRELDTLNVTNIFYIEYLNTKSHNGLRLKKKRRL